MIFLKSYRHYLNPGSRLSPLAGILSILMSATISYSLWNVAYYNKSFDHWLELAAALLMAVCCFALARRHTSFLLLPAAMLAFAACLTYTLAHWMIVALFILLLIVVMLRVPKWFVVLIRTAAVVCAGIGIYETLLPMVQRIEHYAESGNATANYILPLVIRIVGGDVFCIFIFLLLLFALKPRQLPGWQDENDTYDKIWE